MSKTITLSDACAAELLTELNKVSAPGGPPVPPVTPPPVTPPPVTPPPVTPPPDTSGFTAVKSLTLKPWTVGSAPNKHVYTADCGHFNGHDCVVVEIITPPVLGSDAFGAIAWSDVGGDPIMQRKVVISEQPADFDHPIHASAVAPSAANGSIYFSAGPNSAGYPALLKASTKYFCNFRNNQPDQVSPTGHFDLDIEFQNPK